MLHPLFINFIEHFNGDRDYFECHEVLEEYWKEIDPGNKDHPLTAWIQLATGLYHWRRNNYSGALRMMNKSFDKMTDSQDSVFFEGIDMEQLLSDMTRSLDAIKNTESFVPFKLRLSKELLGEQVDEDNLEDLFSKTDPEWLIHKHMRRDRSHILQERQASLEERNKNRTLRPPQSS